MTIQKWGFLIFCLMFIIGCQTNEEGAAPDREGQLEGRMLQVEHTNDRENEEKSNQEIANHLAEIASSVPEVNDASALVAGPYAVVAINVDSEIDRARVSSIKYSVSEALYHDPWGKTAVVVADADMMTRLRGMGDRIQQGYPIQGVADELAAIVARYMPEFPVNDDQPLDRENQENRLYEDEQLDDVQDKQSHHMKDTQ